MERRFKFFSICPRFHFKIEWRHLENKNIVGKKRKGEQKFCANFSILFFIPKF